MRGLLTEKTEIILLFKKGEYFGKERDMMVAYDEKVGEIEIITIHPLEKEQKENRIKSGRWRKV